MFQNYFKVNQEKVRPFQGWTNEHHFD